MTRAKDTVVCKNLYYMLAYAFELVGHPAFKRLDVEEFESALDMYAAVLGAGVSLQIKRGLEQGYRPCSEELRGLRGRIDVRKTMRVEAAHRVGAVCTYGELSPDTYRNRVLKTCLRILLTEEDVTGTHREVLRRCLVYLGDVETLDVRSIKWGRLHPERHDRLDDALMWVCNMVVTHRLQTEGLRREAQGKGDFLDLLDTAKNNWLASLFERFVRNYFRTEHPEIQQKERTIGRGIASGSERLLPKLQADIILCYGPHELVIDTKCYGQILSARFKTDKEDGAEKGKLRPSHLNQIQSYVLHEAFNDGGAEVQGMLLYALTERDEALRENSAWDELGHRFYAWALDLGQDFAGISGQLDKVARLITS